MSKEYTITVRLTANEGAAIDTALRYATRPDLADEWSQTLKERRAAETARSKVVEVLERWERGR